MMAQQGLPDKIIAWPQKWTPWMMHNFLKNIPTWQANQPLIDLLPETLTVQLMKMLHLSWVRVYQMPIEFQQNWH